MKKALVITNTASMIHLFNRENIDILRNAGYEVHIACNFVDGNTVDDLAIEEFKREWTEAGLITHHIHFLRSPFSLKSFGIYRETKKLIKAHQYDLIHCHTPIVAAFVRLAARKARKKGTKVMYTAHGFHFYSGCPKFNWLTYYFVEKLLAPVTDTLITINREDYTRARRKFKKCTIEYVNGVGIDTAAIAATEPDRKYLNRRFGISDEDTVLISVGELNENKNHEMIIRALAQIKRTDIQYIIVGIGHSRSRLIEITKELGIRDRVHFAGYRSDVYRLLKSCDIFCFPSFREGLSVALMEAMAAGLPVVASRIRGNIDLIEEGDGGFLCECKNEKNFVYAIKALVNGPNLRTAMGEFNMARIKEFDEKVVSEKMKDILLNEKRKPEEEVVVVK